MIWYSHLFKSSPKFVMIHTVKKALVQFFFLGFGAIDETEIVVFLAFPNFVFDPTDVGNLTSGSFSFSKPSLDI